MSNLYAVVLAAGQGTRMKSNKSKVMHQVSGKPMIGHVVDTLQKLGVKETVVVVGHQGESIQDYFGDRVQYVWQKEQLGTAHAVKQAEQMLKNKQGNTLVVMGDTPLITVDTLELLINEHQQVGAAATILTTKVDNPTGYGRILRDNQEQVYGVVEEKDAGSDQKLIKEINTGTYIFDNQKLFSSLNKVNNNNAQGEYYLPDVISILVNQQEIIGAYPTINSWEILGINDRVALAEAEQLMRKSINLKHMRAGVTFIDPNSTYIEADVEIGQDTILYPQTILRGKTKIGSESEIGPNVNIQDTVIGQFANITHSVIMSSRIDDSVKVGPYAYIRPGTEIHASAKVGDFVEVKNSIIGKGTKVPHLSYIGDTTLGNNVNIGAGTITVNYDGFKKHRTEVGDNAFIGCNSNLVAPVTIGNDVYVAAGSTITDAVPDYGLAIARARQVNKEEYVKKIREKKKDE